MTSPHEADRESAPDETGRPTSSAQGADRPDAPPAGAGPTPSAAQGEAQTSAAAHAGTARVPSASAPGPAWSDSRPTPPVRPAQDATTVLPAGVRPGSPPPRAFPTRTDLPPRAEARPGTTRPVAARARRTRLTWKRIDPWSVFLFSLVASVFLGIALVVAVAVLYAVLGVLGVTESLNELYAEVTGGDLATEALLTSGRVLGFATVLALVNVVFLTLLATLGALLYNLCASFTGGLELTFGERD